MILTCPALILIRLILHAVNHSEDVYFSTVQYFMFEYSVGIHGTLNIGKKCVVHILPLNFNLCLYVGSVP